MNESQIQQLTSKLDPLDIRIELFKKRDFEFIVTGKNEDGIMCTHEKQRDALNLLTSNKISEFLYGGAAGGAKTWTGCSALMFMGLLYPGTRYFIARNELKDLVESVLVTFNKAAKLYGFEEYKFNGVKNYIQFENGSYINFVEIKYKPSDPMFEDLGSTEYTAGWIEECGEINEMGAIVLSSRVGRHLNSKYGIKGFTFYTGNPKNNWMKQHFYMPWTRNELKKDQKYLPCLITENPFLPKEYIEKMRKIGERDKSLYKRLFLGDWDYEDNPNALCDMEMIDAMFENDHVEQGYTYLTADIARFGSDKARIGVWRGWRLIEVVSYDISKTTDLQLMINLLRRKYHIPKNRSVGDADGVGGGVIDNTGIKGFVNNARPIKQKGEDQNYKNLQVQCLYKLADIINEGLIWINCDISEKERQEIREEIFEIQSKISDNGKLDCKSKSDIKQDIGRSPDWRDMIMMRAFFEIKPIRKRIMGTIPK